MTDTNVERESVSATLPSKDVAELRVDHERMEPHRDGTGIYVRAKNSAGTWSSFDIAQLDRASLHSWLRSRGGENLWAENVVLELLGHKQIKQGETS